MLLRDFGERLFINPSIANLIDELQEKELPSDNIAGLLVTENPFLPEDVKWCSFVGMN